MIGIYNNPPIPALTLLLTFRIDIAARVPSTVETTVETIATVKLLLNASIT
ncbi:hypothetical protein D3C75_1224840 [compost metagenome]